LLRDQFRDLLLVAAFGFFRLSDNSPPWSKVTSARGDPSTRASLAARTAAVLNAKVNQGPPRGRSTLI
jgi:hypothetical protein